MTLGVVLTCSGGVVIGSDKKTVRDKGVDIQRHTSKIHRFELSSSSPLYCCNAGARTVAHRVLGQINPNQHAADKTGSFTNYMSNVVERIIPKFSRDYQNKHGRMPNFRLALGTIQKNEPIVATVYPSGQFDYDERYTAIGSGSLLAEHFLRDPFVEDCDLEQARKLVGYIIQRVAEVDSNVDGIEVTSIDNDGNVTELSPAYITALQVADVFNQKYEMDISSDIEEISQLAAVFEEIEADEGGLK